MAAILDFKMAAIQKPTFAYNSRTKYDKKKNSTGIFGYLSMDLFKLLE